MNLSQEELEKSIRKIPQKEFTPSPFSQSQWEYVGPRIENMDFHPLSIPVSSDERMKADEMFEQFGTNIDFTVFHHTPKGTVASLPPTKDEIEEIQKTKQEAAHKEELETRYAEGFTAGEEQAKAIAQAEMEEALREQEVRFSAFFDQMRDEIRRVCKSVEREAFQLALSVSHRILKTTVDIQPEYILEVIKAGLQSLGGARPFEIRVSIDDAEFLNVIGIPQDLFKDDEDIRIVADESITGGCVIQTNFGAVDLQIDTMWNQIKDKLYEKVQEV